MTLASPAEIVYPVPPRFRTLPEGIVSTAGGECVELAHRAGLDLDDWQVGVSHDTLSERADGRWAATEVGLIVPRQNGKGSILEAVELHAVFLAGAERVVHSAHRYDTSMDAFGRFLGLIEDTPAFAKIPHKIIREHSREGVVFSFPARKNRPARQCYIRFQTRTAEGGRGLWGDLVILDEAFDLSAASLAALLPTLSTRKNPQVWFTSSAGKKSSVVLKKLRDRGIAGEDRLCFLEWSIDADAGPVDPDDPDTIQVANPGYLIRLNPEVIDIERANLSEEDFLRERLGIWDNPRVEAPIDPAKWTGLADPDSRRASTPVFGVDVTPDRSRSTIGLAAYNGEGFVHNELVEVFRGTGQIVPRCVELNAKWGPTVFAIDGRSPAVSLVPDFQSAGIEPLVLSQTDMGAACGLFSDRVDQRLIRHPGIQPQIPAALGVASKRIVGDGLWVWTRKDGSADISPVVCLTVAGYALATEPSRTKPRDGSAWGYEYDTVPVTAGRTGEAW